ncbi:MAG: hypothetical protein ACLQVJ_23565 [Syntrophobacteraceae bacterium]
MVRVKFKVDEIRRHFTSLPVEGKKDHNIRGEVRTVIMSPIHGGGDPGHENTKFWRARPSGKLELGCANLAAAEMFEIGQEYYIDFIKAEFDDLR